MNEKKSLQNQRAVTANGFIKVQYQTTTTRYLCSCSELKKREKKKKNTKLKNIPVKINFAVKGQSSNSNERRGEMKTRARFLECTAFEFD